ncbi:MAG: DNA-processing protein DprA [Treponema sp.]|nr:DNA-processing protein DprA [Treponema sp.]
MDNRTSLLDLMICRIPGINRREKIELEKKFDSEADFAALSQKDIEHILGRAIRGRAWDMADVRSAAEGDARTAQRCGIHRVSWRDSAYPPLLREIYDPPAILFYRGELPDPEKPLVAVVGTRKPSSFAARRAYTLGRELGEAGFSVVSGLALGVDAMAHRGNLEGRGRTVAVLGCGADYIYPVSNRPLARRILETGGVILSEYAPGTRPDKWNFPARNRIVAALARGTVIVEAPQKSGALITARLALEQGRDVWVDRVGITSPQGEGTAKLVQEGAKVIDSVKDIFTEWNIAYVEREGASTLHAETRNSAAGAGLAESLADYLEITL